MIIQEDDSSATYKIQRFEPGKIWINQECYTHSVIVKPHKLIKWSPESLKDVTEDDFALLLSPQVDIVLLGTGPHLVVPSQSLLRGLFEQGIGVEFMDSKAACRTYSVLSSEMRNVAACILIL